MVSTDGGPRARFYGAAMSVPSTRVTPPRHDAHVLVIGGGGTGAALAHDLTLRGLRVTLVERGELTSGTTGRHHGLLHSGGRYAVSDRASAIECIEENTILRRICPGIVRAQRRAVRRDRPRRTWTFLEPFLEGCAACGIPDAAAHGRAGAAPGAEPQSRGEGRRAGPGRDDRRDAHADALLRDRQAQRRRDLDLHGGRRPRHARRRRRRRGRCATLSPARRAGSTPISSSTPPAPGPARVAAMAGVDVPIRPSPGVLVAVRGRLCNMVVNRLHKSSGRRHRRAPARPVGHRHHLVGRRRPGRARTCPRTTSQRMYGEGAMLLPAVATAPSFEPPGRRRAR